MNLKNICNASINYIRVAMLKKLNTYENFKKVQKINTDDVFSKLEN